MNNKVVQIKLNGVKKFYEQGRIKALRGLSLEIYQGEFVAVMGPSGSGKSTLLNMIAGLDKPDEGFIEVGGIELDKMRDLSNYRALVIGFVFQMHNLLPTLTAIENVQVPMLENSKIKRSQRKNLANNLLNQAGLRNRDNSLPNMLSGGERQRVAVARALANDPEIIIADEPTGNLDSENTEQIMNLLKKINRELGKTVVIVTHDAYVAGYAHRTVRMKDGQITGL